MTSATARLDGWLTGAAVALLALGVLAAASAGGATSLAAPFEGGPGTRQLVLAALGLAALAAVSLTDYRWLARHAIALYVLTLALLTAVLLLGFDANGARRWIDLGAGTVQPSELTKVVLVAALAALLAGRRPAGGLAGAALLVTVPLAGLVLLQPDAGTAFVLVLAWLISIVAAGVSWRVIGVVLVAGVAVVPLVFAVAVPDYQRERLAVYFDPARDPLGSGFNVRQAELAIGSGGLTGNGLFDGEPSALEPVAARASDFVFAQIAEDLGLLGTGALLALFGILAWRGLEAARRAPDAFGQLLAAGLTLTIVAQAALHIAVNVRVIPATGITLPLVSAGGSSVLVVCLAIGLLQSVAARGPASAREQWSGARWR